MSWYDKGSIRPLRRVPPFLFYAIHPISRIALLADWAAGLDNSGIVPDVQGEQTVFLIPNYLNEDEAWKFIAQVHEQLFGNQLWIWRADMSAWPKNLDFKTFQEWFSIELHSVVEDLCGSEIFDE